MLTGVDNMHWHRIHVITVVVDRWTSHSRVDSRTTSRHRVWSRVRSSMCDVVQAIPHLLSRVSFFWSIIELYSLPLRHLDQPISLCTCRRRCCVDDEFGHVDSSSNYLAVLPRGGWSESMFKQLSFQDHTLQFDSCSTPRYQAMWMSCVYKGRRLLHSASVEPSVNLESDVAVRSLHAMMPGQQWCCE
jgi:hypothetical protein